MMRLATLFVLSAFLAAPLSAMADDAKKMPELTKEERAKRADMMDKMADMHKKMAECLRSDKPMSECHEMMKKECPMMKEGHECPMMEEMEMHHHHGHHGKGKMMKEESEKK